MKARLISLLCVLLMLSSCSAGTDDGSHTGGPKDEFQSSASENDEISSAITEVSAFEGYFEGKDSNVTVECLSGDDGAFEMVGSTAVFSEITSESIYKISGQLNGSIVIDIGDEQRLTLELCGLSIVSEDECPIVIKSGDEVTVKAKKDTKNYIYDMRAELDPSDETALTPSVWSEVDLEIGGKGELFVVSKANNGIYSKDDLKLKNLTLYVECADNSLKADSVEMENASTTLIASLGDCIKTKSSGISGNGNQKGDVTITGGVHTLFAACDGIDAAHDVIIDGETTSVEIFTDKYSSYSKEVTASDESNYYIRFTSNAYSYSVKYYNSDSDYLWVDATYHSSVSGGRSNYYYYSFPKNESYGKMQFFIYSSEMPQGQEDEYLVCSEYLERNTSYDTFALTSRGNQLSYSWTNYTTSIQEGGFGGGFGPGGPGDPGGPGGGFGEGNSDKGDYSTKGIKAANSITINSGRIDVKSYDDSLHAGDELTLENGKSPLGDITINGGNVTLYSNDDGIHADGSLSLVGGSIDIVNSYEGLEGNIVSITGGNVSICSKDDGINSTATSGESIKIGGGTIYVNSTGDGIDSNSRTSYRGIVFSGGNTVIISASNGNSAIDSEQGYSYEGGSVIAIMSRGGMANEAIHCESFSSVGDHSQRSLNANEILEFDINGCTAYVKVPTSLSALIVVLGDNSPSISTVGSIDVQLDKNGIYFQ